MIAGYIKKRSETDYVVNCAAQGTDYIIAPLGTLELKEDKAK
jgi:hypothetical protein